MDNKALIKTIIIIPLTLMGIYIIANGFATWVIYGLDIKGFWDNELFSQFDIITGTIGYFFVIIIVLFVIFVIGQVVYYTQKTTM